MSDLKVGQIRRNDVYLFRVEELLTPYGVKVRCISQKGRSILGGLAALEAVLKWPIEGDYMFYEALVDL